MKQSTEAVKLPPRPLLYSGSTLFKATTGSNKASAENRRMWYSTSKAQPQNLHPCVHQSRQTHTLPLSYHYSFPDPSATEENLIEEKRKGWMFRVERRMSDFCFHVSWRHWASTCSLPLFLLLVWSNGIYFKNAWSIYICSLLIIILDTKLQTTCHEYIWTT